VTLLDGYNDAEMVEAGSDNAYYNVSSVEESASSTEDGGKRGIRRSLARSGSRQ